jgi:hypothetical protein
MQSPKSSKPGFSGLWKLPTWEATTSASVEPV